MRNHPEGDVNESQDRRAARPSPRAAMRGRWRHLCAATCLALGLSTGLSGCATWLDAGTAQTPATADVERAARAFAPAIAARFGATLVWDALPEAA